MGANIFFQLAVLVAGTLYLTKLDQVRLGTPVVLVGLAVTEVFLSLLYQGVISRWFVSATKDLPYPKGQSPILGHLHQFLSEPWGFPLAKWQVAIPKSTSGFYRVFIGPFDWLIPTTASSIAVVMGQHSQFIKPKTVRDGLVQTLGVGLVAAEGHTYRKQKKLITPMFGLNRNRRLVQQVWPKGLILEDFLRNQVIATGGSKNIEMHPLTMAATLDVIGVATLGVDFDSVRNPDQKILRAYQAVFPTVKDDKTRFETLVEDMLPVLVSPFILYKLPLKRFRNFHWGLSVLKESFVKQIEAKKQELKDQEEKAAEFADNDFLSAIVAAGDVDEEETISHILTIMAAGHESTALTLAWAIFKLAQLPDVQSELRKEVQTTLSSNGTEIPTLELINSMTYLRCFMMELLRLYPAFPGMIREASRPAIISDLKIAQGTKIMVSPYAINRSPDFWGQDAEEFRVERWQQSYTGGATSSQAFMTFSSGPRICVGKDFATTSLKVFLCILIQTFKFEEAAPGFHPKIQKGTSLKPDHIEVKVSLLNKV